MGHQVKEISTRPLSKKSKRPYLSPVDRRLPATARSVTCANMTMDLFDYRLRRRTLVLWAFRWVRWVSESAGKEAQRDEITPSAYHLPVVDAFQKGNRNF